jgi:hypothetical protein
VEGSGVVVAELVEGVTSAMRGVVAELMSKADARDKARRREDAQRQEALSAEMRAAEAARRAEEAARFERMLAAVVGTRGGRRASVSRRLSGVSSGSDEAPGEEGMQTPRTVVAPTNLAGGSGGGDLGAVAVTVPPLATGLSETQGPSRGAQPRDASTAEPAPRGGAGDRGAPSPAVTTGGDGSLMEAVAAATGTAMQAKELRHTIMHGAERVRMFSTTGGLDESSVRHGTCCGGRSRSTPTRCGRLPRWRCLPTPRRRRRRAR